MPTHDKKITLSHPWEDQPLAEHIDYYVDCDGKMVFTVAYHLKRGDCCHNRCRHCPYELKTQN